MRKRLTKAKSGYVFKIGENEGQGECFRGLIPSKEERDGEKCMRQIRANRWHQWIETVELFGKCSWSAWNWEEKKTETTAGTHICPEERLNREWFL